tara:strand:- start:1945 stop:2193 length:249 start_codon:yes stop_codon:yes gene_type:complete
MSDFLISANKVIFKNPYGAENIQLYHYDEAYKLEFGSMVNFTKTTNMTTIKMGEFFMQKHESENRLIFGKGDQILMSIEPPS